MIIKRSEENIGVIPSVGLTKCKLLVFESVTFQLRCLIIVCFHWLGNCRTHGYFLFLIRARPIMCALQ